MLLQQDMTVDFSLNDITSIKITEEIILNHIEKFEYEKESVQKLITFQDDDFYQIDKTEYINQCQEVVDKIKNGEIDKMILSRVIKNENNSVKDASQLFFKLECKYDHAFIFLINIQGTLTWIGASPELLADYSKGVFTSVSLAGTKKPEKKWTSKEYYEQELVTNYIVDIFKKNECQSVKIGERLSVRAGDFEHLMTQISAKPEKKRIVSLVKDLNPTPALCGYPKEKSYELIIKTEKHSRLYYGGFIGIINSDSTKESHNSNQGFKLFVNLRSSLLLKNKSYIFVGGGITQDSIPENEWEETCIKSQTILSVFK